MPLGIDLTWTHSELQKACINVQWAGNWISVPSRVSRWAFRQAFWSFWHWSPFHTKTLALTRRSSKSTMVIWTASIVSCGKSWFRAHLKAFVPAGGNVYSNSLNFTSLTPRGSGVFFKIRSVVVNSFVELFPAVFLLDGPPSFVSVVTRTVCFKASLLIK